MVLPWYEGGAIEVSYFCSIKVLYIFTCAYSYDNQGQKKVKNIPEIVYILHDSSYNTV